MDFKDAITKGYTFKGEYFTMGTAMLQSEAITGAKVKIPLKTLNRHGLIAGATGTGKTKTVQIIAERLSEHGVSVLMMDFKGDLSGIAKEGTTNKHVKLRHDLMGEPWEAKEFPTEFLTISNQSGIRLRATISEFGPVLFSKILGVNDTQSGVISIVFSYCDNNNLPLLDLKDFRRVLQYVSNEGKEEISEQYGYVSPSSIGAILRRVLELETQGANQFFGERSFDVNHLLKAKEGRGNVNIIRLDDIQDKPKLFSTFMLCLLSEIYQEFPEIGDSDKPKLVIFIDEAHLVFKEASSALLEQLEMIIKLIRSKGVGICFCTQNPNDIPAAILSQLGLKVQHALRAFTAKDRKAIKMVAENYPYTEYYDVASELTKLGIGEAFISALNEKGIPTPLVHTLLRSPSSRMDVISDQEKEDLIKGSDLVPIYNEVIDRESAYEILESRLKKAKKDVEEIKSSSKKRASTKAEKSAFESFVSNTTTRQIGRTIARELTRGLLGVLGLKK